MALFAFEIGRRYTLHILFSAVLFFKDSGIDNKFISSALPLFFLFNYQHFSLPINSGYHTSPISRLPPLVCTNASLILPSLTTLLYYFWCNFLSEPVISITNRLGIVFEYPDSAGSICLCGNPKYKTQTMQWLLLNFCSKFLHPLTESVLLEFYFLYIKRNLDFQPKGLFILSFLFLVPNFTSSSVSV